MLECKQSAPNLVKMYVTIRSRMRLIMDLIAQEMSGRIEHPELFPLGPELSGRIEHPELFPLEFEKIAESCLFTP